MTTAETAERFRGFAQSEAGHLPVYCRLVTVAADDPRVMELMEQAPRGQRQPNLLLAAVHDLLLAGADDELAAWYPTVNGGEEPPADDPASAFDAFVDAHEAELADALATRATQTNEPNRSCLWRAVLPSISDGPLHLVELGASAGLNLCFDRYRYEFTELPVSDDPRGDVLRCQFRGERPPIDRPIPPIASRVGLDLDPIDVRDEREVRWLKACIWPEQLDRHRRFDHAVSVVAADPPEIVRGDLVDDLPALFERFGPDDDVVVINSWVLFYVRRDRRAELEDVLGELSRSTAGVTWVSAEGPGIVSWAGQRDEFLVEPHSVVARSRWRNGELLRRDLVARCHAHLAWLEWSAQPK
ncbi:MAG TPA: DUF2332 domain-containing protein [Microthrixaceae bacterium]|nr:DUF2332 domain-containing protein [Microthrixaceae bacterium]